MIKRIVKLTFQDAHVDIFLEVFNQNKYKIANSKGCHSVEILQSVHQKNIFFTYSFWDSEEDLNSYRHSELFKTTWAKTKILFSEKPEAWTVNSLDTIHHEL